MANTFLIAERDRWPLWLPVALGAGAGGYFALPFEPPAAIAWVALGLTWVTLTLAILGRARWQFAFLWALLAALLLGFGLAKLRESRIATPVLDHAVVAHLTGRVLAQEPRQLGERLILADVHSGALPNPPKRVVWRCGQPVIFGPAIG